MEGIYYTLHDFLYHTESITYLLIVLALIGIAAFWRFLAETDDD